MPTITLIINGESKTYQIESYEFSYAKYKGYDFTLIFNGELQKDSQITAQETATIVAESSDSITQSVDTVINTGQKTYVAEGVRRPSPTGYAKDVDFKYDGPFSLNEILTGVLIDYRKQANVTIISSKDINVQDYTPIELKTQYYKSHLVNDAIKALVEEEKNLCDFGGQLVAVSEPKINLIPSEFSSAEDLCYLTEKVFVIKDTVK